MSFPNTRIRLICLVLSVGCLSVLVEETWKLGFVGWRMFFGGLVGSIYFAFWAFRSQGASDDDGGREDGEK